MLLNYPAKADTEIIQDIPLSDSAHTPKKRFPNIKTYLPKNLRGEAKHSYQPYNLNPQTTKDL
jgi:hypothetical protein